MVLLLQITLYWLWLTVVSSQELYTVSLLYLFTISLSIPPCLYFFNSIHVVFWIGKFYLLLCFIHMFYEYYCPKYTALGNAQVNLKVLKIICLTLTFILLISKNYLFLISISSNSSIVFLLCILSKFFSLVSKKNIVVFVPKSIYHFCVFLFFLNCIRLYQQINIIVMVIAGKF